MKKGVAVPYIIAVILGIAVIGIIGYYFFYISGNITTEATLQDCQRKLTVYCSVWLAEGYSGTNSDRLGAWSEYARGCSVIGVPASGSANMKAECDRLLGRQTAGSSGTPTRTPPVSADRTGKAGGPCKSGGVCDSTDLKCERDVCVTR